LRAAALVAPVKRIALVTKPIDGASPAFDLSHAEALLGLLTPLIRPMIDVAVTAALQQSRDEQNSNEPDVFTLTEFCKRNHMGKSKWHELVKTGLAPEFMRYGKEYRITRKAEAEWRAMMAQRAKSAEVQLEHARRVEMAKKAGKFAGKSPNHVCRQKPDRVGKARSKRG
jgi:hypothetical protein